MSMSRTATASTPPRAALHPHGSPGLRLTLRFALLAALVATAACRVPGAEEPGTPTTGDVRAEARAAVDALHAAEDLLEEGRHAEAAAKADSVYAAIRPDRGLRALANRALRVEARAQEAGGDLAGASATLEVLLDRLERGEARAEAVAALARIHLRTGEDEAAARLLLENPEAVEAAERELLRESLTDLPLQRLQALTREYPVGRRGAAVLHAALARELVLADRIEDARAVARRLLEAAPAEEERRLAEAILDAEGGLSGPVRLGVVLPLSGRFAEVGGYLREGIELAVQAFGEGPGRGIPVEVLYRDDASRPDRAPALVAELEREGVVAVVGPLRSESFAAAARARASRRLPLVSPTATDVVDPAPAAYTLWDRSRRERDVASDVASFATTRLGAREGAILHPSTDSGRWAVEGFAAGMETAGGRMVLAVPYAPQATTFQQPIRQAVSAAPDLVYVAAESVPQLLQLAPQLTYYGLRRSLVAGGTTWAEPAALRRLEPHAINHRIVGTFVDRSADGAWSRFEKQYEVKYRKPLGENMLPGLGHDAAWMILLALREAGLPLPGAVAAALEERPEIEGATGTLRPDPETSTVARRTRVRMVVNRSLVDVDAARLMEWLERSRARADSLRVREEREEREEQGAPPPRRP